MPSRLTMLMAGALLLPAALDAQTPAHDPSSTLQQVLPPAVAEQVLARIAEARQRELPAAALEHRALELQAKGMPPDQIPAAVAQAEQQMADGKAALVSGGRSEPSDEEVDAAGTALGKGVDGSAISALAKSAPSGRSLAVPLAVLTSLTDRGLPSDEALAKVVERLQARASDEQLASLPDQAAAGQSHKPATTGQDLAGTKRPSDVPPSGVSTGRPTSVPSGGRGSRPSTPSHPGGRP